jgi:hypothetical protein
MPEFKRSADHVVATALIWEKMIEMLNINLGIGTLDQLSDWLASTEPAGRSRRIYPMAPEKRLRLPDEPGIYRMLRANGDLLYVGKAKSLKKRVNSYFRPKAPHAEHTLEMLTQAQKLDFTLTGSALEAAMQESDEIKRHSPPYNIALRKRQRKLVFCTKNLSRQARVADEDYTIGPLPDGRFIAAVSAMGQWITDGYRSADQELLSTMRFEKKQQTLHEFGHKAVIQFFHCIGGGVVVRIAEKSRIRDHDGFIALVPERGVVTESDRGYNPAVERNS